MEKFQKPIKAKLMVKVGSHNVLVQVTNDTKCSNVVSKALLECNIKQTKGYAIFERSRGIEYKLNPNIKMFDLMKKWDANQKYELLVKKCVQIQRDSLVAESMIKMMRKHKRKLFTVKNTTGTDVFFPTEIHVYETIY